MQYAVPTHICESYELQPVIEPRGNRLLVELIGPPRSESGLILQMPAFGIKTSQDQRGHRGRVLAVGPGKKTRKGVLVPPSVAPGDIVWFGEFDFKRWTENGITHMLISEMDVCGVEEA